MEAFADQTEAEGAAEIAIKRIANGEQKALELRNEDQFEYLRAKEALAGLAVTLDTAASQYAEAIKILAGKDTLVEACREYVKRHGGVAAKIMVVDAVKEMIQEAEKEQEASGRRRG